MGGSVSAGRNNDELIDNLVDGGLIKTQQVERVFRAVDRGIFYLPNYRDTAYRDLAWREGFIHISAPCIYTKVMESLDIKQSNYFLNIGSGTGYFSSMVGLIIGSNGINHNIELHEELINYSRQKVAEFIQTSPYFDDFDFCKPKFIHGNVLNLVTPSPILYDRIYVGAAVNIEHEDLIKNLLKIGGVCIMPLNDNLVRIKRVNEDTWEKNVIMSVSYALLVTENVDPNARLTLPFLNPYSLQELCRFKIRQTIREAIEIQDENYYKIKRHLSTFNPNREPKKTITTDSDNDTGENDNDDDGDDDDENSFAERRYGRISESRLRGMNNINNDLRLMIYGNLIDPDGTFTVRLRRNEHDVQNPALVLLRPTQINSENRNEDDNNDNDNDNEEDPEALVDSGVSEGSQISSQSISMTEPSKIDEENADLNKINKTSKIYDRNSSFTRQENLLRCKIMQLPLSNNVKNFLLYYRDI